LNGRKRHVWKINPAKGEFIGIYTYRDKIKYVQQSTHFLYD